MTDGEALMKAIIASPSDDTPRLVYADWLQENGEHERAEFIRAQCEAHRLNLRLAKNGFCVGNRDRRCRVAENRANELRKLYSSQWFPFPCRSVWWERGFVDSVYDISAGNWVKYADAILANHPIWSVSLKTLPRAVGNNKAVRFRGRAAIRPWAGAFIGAETQGAHLLAMYWPGIRFSWQTDDYFAEVDEVGGLNIGWR